MEITTNLSWKNHILTVSENANKKLNILAKLNMLVDRKSLITTYTSFIQSDMEHGSIVYCNCSDTDDEMLESVQRRTFKIIYGGIIRTPTLNLYNEIGLETLKKRGERSVLLFFFKAINNMVPDYLLELKPEKKKEGRYMLRTRHEYTTPSWRITKYKKSFLPFAVNLWNNLDEETQSTTNYERFKDALGTNIKENPLFLIGTKQEQVIIWPNSGCDAAI